MCANCPFFFFFVLWFKGWRQEALEQSKTIKQKSFFFIVYNVYNLPWKKKNIRALWFFPRKKKNRDILRKVCIVSNRKQNVHNLPVGFSAPSNLAKALACFDFMMIALDLVRWGVILSNVSSSPCSWCGTLEKRTCSPNIYVTSMFEINVKTNKRGNKKKVTYETVPSCLSPKTTEWIKRSTRTMNFFFFCKYYILQKTYSRGRKCI